MTDYYPDLAEVIVEYRLEQTVTVMDPRAGRRLSKKTGVFAGLSKGMLEDYGGNWIDVELADCPEGSLVRIEQSAMLTSQQLPRLSHCLDSDTGFKPRREAVQAAQMALRKWDAIKTWGGSR